MLQFGNNEIKEIYFSSDKIKEVYNGSDLVWGEAPIEGWDGIFADPEVGRVLHDNGLIADANKSSIEELATITSLNPGNDYDGSYFYGNEVITQFPELKYFTGLTSLSGVFGGCRNLITVVIPEGVTDLSSAFGDCSSLTTAPDIPSSVTDLHDAFSGCSSIDGIYIINAVTPPSCSSSSFSNVQAIYVPDASVNKYKTASGWIQFADNIYPMSNKPQ